MNETHIPKFDTSNVKLYSIKAIIIATLLGTPLASGYLIGENFKSLGQKEKSQTAVFIGILATLFIFTGLFFLPDNVLDKIPNTTIPLVYTLIVYAILLATQGDLLKAHQKNSFPLHSIWRGVAIGVISLIIVVGIAFGASYFMDDTPINDDYAIHLEDFTRNEQEGLVFYEILNNQPDDILLHELDYKAIPSWEENIIIIHEAEAIEDLPSELQEQNKILLKYAELRLEALQLFRKKISENTDSYDQQLDQLHDDIENVLDELP